MHALVIKLVRCKDSSKQQHLCRPNNELVDGCQARHAVLGVPLSLAWPCVSLLPAVLSITNRGAVTMGRARLLTGLIGRELKEALPVGWLSLTVAPA